jgi:energy-converting hydrogenase Eha subunit E
MGKNKTYKLLLLSQGIYYLLTGAWALIDIDSFMAVTGPKSDIWLVKTVSALIVAIGVCMIAAAFDKIQSLAIVLLAIISATGLAIIDFYYTANDTIKWVYRIDGFIELLFGIVWLLVLIDFTQRRLVSRKDAMRGNQD